MSVYPQAKPFATDTIEPFLAQPLVATLSSHNPDGTIHTIPIWFHYHDGNFHFGTQEITQKVQNIKRNPNVTVTIQTADPALKSVIIYGTAELDYEDVIAKRRALFEKYMPAENAAGLADDLAKQWTPVIIRVKPDRMINFDYSQGFGIGAEDSGVVI